MEIVDKFLQDKYQKKRAIIIGVYAVIFILLCIGLYAAFKPAPSCFDGRKNQNEEGIDCGGVCALKCSLVSKKDIVVTGTGFVASGLANAFDIYGQITNPNQTIGASNFSYELIAKDATGAVIGTRSGFSFILPGEKKYIIESALVMKQTPASVELTISKITWQEASIDYQAPQLKVVNKNYQEITSGVGFAEATGLLKNESPYDFASINLKILLEDASGKIVAINSTAMNTVQSGENRDFKVSWPSRFPGDVQNIEVQTEVNVFNSQAFSDHNFQPQRFQQY